MSGGHRKKYMLLRKFKLNDMKLKIYRSTAFMISWAFCSHP